ncbi:Osmotically activated L-carnitine/choline ABC transporter, substrate-binding protein OpuCC [Paenibacillus pasadenensis]|uniref:Osmotically activated L-carnitine/choline ABC transporter, substrate-binding protein OpuCC n=1 Tax=Paenibacillus pasadenensis TaxID=217090 RepID=A0A2N5NAN7_9BACL|nr:glycine betaine ABC transporter substrate-binding protein [Paenibacillus pasadenensis]PLT47416.1 Osmotically activated L-carnitine/choline ABC transporter, substrate-binding protein OpuCC [Paenibacillus pasadenensis]
MSLARRCGERGTDKGRCGWRWPKAATALKALAGKPRAARTAASACLVLLLTLAGAGCGARPDLRIGAQTFTETKILAEMYKALIEQKTGLDVKVIPDLAASPLVFSALDRGDIDLATLYSGEIFNNHFPLESLTKDRAEVLRQAQEGFDRYYGFDWMDPLGFENTYAFTVRRQVAEASGYRSISDIKPDAASMRFGVDTSWLERASDGYPAFRQEYGISFAKAYPMELSLVYTAVKNEQVDIVLAYSTDARLKAFDLQTLQDDRHFFPPYDASPVMRKEMEALHPGVKEALRPLIGAIDAETMIGLNYQVDIEKKSEREVALAYLKQKGLIPK